ncbi:potassium channel family protein [Candidatus Poriferisocius sp.]|uniref:potassium channel family protein n=1 Tax=Candidatus Poriferisocius sp. TaxID=3101276 RepID=UPI003B52A470
MLRTPVRRLVRILAEERYDVILALCVAMVTLSAAGIDALTAASGIVGLALITGTLIESSALAVSRAKAWALLAGLGCATAIELAVVGPDDARVSPAIVTAIGIVAVITISRQVLSRPLPDTTSIAASACAYLLIGYSFASLYMLIDRIAADAFLSSGEALTPESAVYFSFVTLTTLGFGDLTPAASSGRTLVTLEAMSGQFYIAIAVARLVAGMATAKKDD